MPPSRSDPLSGAFDIFHDRIVEIPSVSNSTVYTVYKPRQGPFQKQVHSRRTLYFDRRQGCIAWILRAQYTFCVFVVDLGDWDSMSLMPSVASKIGDFIDETEIDLDAYSSAMKKHALEREQAGSACSADNSGAVPRPEEVVQSMSNVRIDQGRSEHRDEGENEKKAQRGAKDEMAEKGREEPEGMGAVETNDGDYMDCDSEDGLKEMRANDSTMTGDELQEEKSSSARRAASPHPCAQSNKTLLEDNLLLCGILDEWKKSQSFEVSTKESDGIEEDGVSLISDLLGEVKDVYTKKMEQARAASTHQVTPRFAFFTSGQKNNSKERIRDSEYVQQLTKLLLHSHYESTSFSRLRKDGMGIEQVEFCRRQGLCYSGVGEQVIMKIDGNESQTIDVNLLSERKDWEKDIFQEACTFVMREDKLRIFNEEFAKRLLQCQPSRMREEASPFVAEVASLFSQMSGNDGAHCFKRELRESEMTPSHLYVDGNVGVSSELWVKPVALQNWLCLIAYGDYEYAKLVVRKVPTSELKMARNDVFGVLSKEESWTSLGRPMQMESSGTHFLIGIVIYGDTSLKDRTVEFINESDTLGNTIQTVLIRNDKAMLVVGQVSHVNDDETASRDDGDGRKRMRME